MTITATVRRTIQEREAEIQLSYLARIEDLGRGDLVKVGWAACHHVALLTPVFLLRLGLNPAAKVLDLKGRVRCRGCGARGRAVVSIKPIVAASDGGWRASSLA